MFVRYTTGSSSTGSIMLKPAGGAMVAQVGTISANNDKTIGVIFAETLPGKMTDGPAARASADAMLRRTRKGTFWRHEIHPLRTPGHP